MSILDSTPATPHSIKLMKEYVVSEKLVADYIEHLTDIEIRKDKRRTDNDRKRAERKQQEYNDID